MKEYNEDDWLDVYVCRNYVVLMTNSEWEGLQALQSEVKTAFYDQEGDDLNTPEVSEALKKFSAYERKVRKRILLEHSDQVDLNRCPKCDRIPRTPRAKMCPWCYHNWHDEAG